MKKDGCAWRKIWNKTAFSANKTRTTGTQLQNAYFKIFSTDNQANDPNSSQAILRENVTEISTELPFQSKVIKRSFQVDNMP